MLNNSKSPEHKDEECVYRLINPFELVTIRALLPLIRRYASLERVSRFVSDDICSALLRTSCFARDASGYPIKRRFKNDNRITYLMKNTSTN